VCETAQSGLVMADPFAELDAVIHAELGADFIVERANLPTGDTVRICIDESPDEAEYGGTRAARVQIIGEILPVDYAKVSEGDYLSDAESRYKITEIMPAVEGSKDLYLRKV
jgi:hypothetical protein